MTSDSALLIEIEGPLVELRLNRPAARNALNAELLGQFARAVEQLERRQDVVAGLICGAGASFCAGADLFELARMAPGEARGLEQLASNTFERLARLPIVWVAALHGHAVGGGLLISLYADVRIAAAGTQLGFPAASQAWLPPWGLSRLAGWVGAARAESLLLSAGLFDAGEAARWGLVDRIVDPAVLDTVARETAARLARSRRAVVAEVRHFFAALRATDHAHWDRVAAAGFERAFASDEAREAIRRFVASRAESAPGARSRSEAAVRRDEVALRDEAGLRDEAALRDEAGLRDEAALRDEAGLRDEAALRDEAGLRDKAAPPNASDSEDTI